MKISSTRANNGPDARRDFEGFDVDEELKRFREALVVKDYRVASELAANIDEYLSRGGSVPVGWLGPTCVQDPSDHEARHDDAQARAGRMTKFRRLEAVSGFVAVRPEP